MTLPSLIAKHQEKATVVKVKKFYSIMSQAVLFARNENGNLDGWDFYTDNDKDSSVKFASYLKPYLKILNDCGDKLGCLKYTDSVKLLNGTNYLGFDSSSSYYKMILADGTYMWLGTNINRNENVLCSQVNNGNSYHYNCATIFIDINGPKAPNTVGKDVFSFRILKDRVTSKAADDCALDKDGWGCGGYILQNDNMDYLKK